MTMTFRSHGHEYIVDDYGIHQMNPEKFVYDANYVKTYDTDAYRKGNDILQALRLGFVIGAHGSVPNSLCDVGFGNGAFLFRCKGVIKKLYGKDVSGVTLPFVENVWKYVPCDVCCFHDVLEHIPDLSFLFDIPCTTIVVSAPYCHFDSPEWFDDWRHRKPNEHLHHWSPETLIKLMDKYGWYCVAESHHETIVRVGKDDRPNILTMGFKRK